MTPEPTHQDSSAWPRWPSLVDLVVPASDAQGRPQKELLRGLVIGGGLVLLAGAGVTVGILWSPAAGVSVGISIMLLNMLIFYGQARRRIVDLQSDLVSTRQSVGAWRGPLVAMLERLDLDRAFSVLTFAFEWSVEPNGDTRTRSRVRMQVDSPDFPFHWFTAGGLDPEDSNAEDIEFTVVNVATGGVWPTLVEWSEFPAGLKERAFGR